MKRYGNLWPQLISFQNLLRAAENARRGKRFRPSVASFEFLLESELWKLHGELVAGTYRPGPYRSFRIFEPKERLISAAPYRDRIVHHALTAMLEPIFERTFIDDSYACRRRKGTHAAVARCQFFSNVYLDPLDHFVKERLRIKGYIRYVDDFLLFADDKQTLANAQRELGSFLAGLRLRLHPKKNVVFPVAEGIRFLGYRVFPTHRRLIKENVWRFLRRIRRMQSDYRQQRITLPEIRQRLMSWSGHARQADTHRLREYLFRIISFQRAAAE